MPLLPPLDERDVLQLGALTLAFVGDAVHSLYVRGVLANGTLKPLVLHKMASDKVRAASQAAWAEQLLSKLTETELSVYHRGRNANVHHKAKNQTSADYRKATGVEAVLGYLYLSGQEERLKQILEEQP